MVADHFAFGLCAWATGLGQPWVSESPSSEQARHASRSAQTRSVRSPANSLLARASGCTTRRLPTQSAGSLGLRTGFVAARGCPGLATDTQRARVARGYLSPLAGPDLRLHESGEERLKLFIRERQVCRNGGVVDRRTAWGGSPPRSPAARCRGFDGGSISSRNELRWCEALPPQTIAIRRGRSN